MLPSTTIATFSTFSAWESWTSLTTSRVEDQSEELLRVLTNQLM